MFLPNRLPLIYHKSSYARSFSWKTTKRDRKPLITSDPAWCRSLGFTLVTGKLNGLLKVVAGNLSHSECGLPRPATSSAETLFEHSLTRSSLPLLLSICPCLLTSKLSATPGKPSLICPTPLITASFKFMMAFYIFFFMSLRLFWWMAFLPW